MEHLALIGSRWCSQGSSIRTSRKVTVSENNLIGTNQLVTGSCTARSDCLTLKVNNSKQWISKLKKASRPQTAAILLETKRQQTTSSFYIKRVVTSKKWNKKTESNNLSAFNKHQKQCRKHRYKLLWTLGFLQMEV